MFGFGDDFDFDDDFGVFKTDDFGNKLSKLGITTKRKIRIQLNLVDRIKKVKKQTQSNKSRRKTSKYQYFKTKIKKILWY